MMNKRMMRAGLGAVLAALLSACSYKVQDPYPQGAFLSPDFLSNFLTDYHQVSPSVTHAFGQSTSPYFDGFHEGDFYDAGGQKIFSGPQSMYPEIFQYHEGSSVVTLDASPSGDWSQEAEGQDDSRYIGKAFGRTKCLGRVDSTFKEGLLSKLYNGQMYCLALHNEALIQLDRQGLDARFPKSLATGDYFLMSFRGGSLYGIPRITTFDLTLCFYQGTVAYEHTFSNLLTWTDNGGDGDSFFGFKFSDFDPAFDPKGMSGWGLRYDHVQDPALAGQLTPAEQANPNAYWGMLIYEVMLPDSSWA